MVMHEAYSYDEFTDSLFISMPIDYKYNGVIEIEEGEIMVEFDTNNTPRAIEILNASMVLNTESKNLLKENIKKIELTFEVTNDKISVELELVSELNLENNNIKIVETGLNSVNIPENTQEFLINGGLC
ncbi:DUF2283 domain-containing protein [Methanosphaera cuniculi]|uniref:DUF2283 domain-containing protein n=1 Tax=Methanosphaera cuniculi TaxID=1077256 RepID=UPI0026E9E58B|nr:DUF2283 domain-containing protein [Methanosphaera cuniculi]